MLSLNLFYTGLCSSLRSSSSCLTIPDYSSIEKLSSSILQIQERPSSCLNFLCGNTPGSTRCGRIPSHTSGCARQRPRGITRSQQKSIRTDFVSGRGGILCRRHVRGRNGHNDSPNLPYATGDPQTTSVQGFIADLTNSLPELH